MHDKYLIADDHAYLLGGRNTYDLFLREDLDRYNIDRDVLVYTETGGSLSVLTDYFSGIWAISQAAAPRGTEEARQALRQRAGSLEERYPGIAAPVDWIGETLPAEQVTLLTNPPHPGNKEPTLWSALCLLMQQGQEVRIQTPYIICGSAMYRDLEEVASRTASLQIMTNAPEGGANPFGCADFLNQKHRLLNLGAQTLEWLGGQSLHAKTVLIDENLSIIGSFNLDMRSTYLDTELMVVIDCPQLNRLLRESFEEMAAQSRISDAQGEHLSESCEVPAMPPLKHLLYGLLRILLLPIRHLL